MSEFINAIKGNTLVRTENNALAHPTTCSKLYDLFALGGAYRRRSDEDCILLFKEALEENPIYAMKCLFYLRDREGVGERRFFRVCLRWLANEYPQYVFRNLHMVPQLGRWDDLYELVGTLCEEEVLFYITEQLWHDYRNMDEFPPSLAAKWSASESASSSKSRHLARLTAKAMGISNKHYRKILSALRERINIVERLMSDNKWDSIEYDKLPSKAGLNYRNAFMRHDYERYCQFAHSKNTRVNAGTLYPYEVVKKASNHMKRWNPDPVEREIINKYWDNMTDYFNSASVNALVVCDTSGSMTSPVRGTRPIDIAISLALYAAGRAQGPFHNHYISFSRKARLIECSGIDFCDKVERIERTNLCENTNLESVFNLVAQTGVDNNLPQSAIPETLIVITDMEVDSCSDLGNDDENFIQTIKRRWPKQYKFPSLIFWNVDARHNTFLSKPDSSITYVSGASPILFQAVLQNKTGIDIMWDMLDKDRYQEIH